MGAMRQPAEATGGRRRATGARWRVPRSRGAIAGALLVPLGLWGSLIPFIGPYFDYGFGADATWTWTAARFWLQVLPGIATVAGGILLALSATRVLAAAGGWLASVAGAWFIIGPSISALWNPGTLGRPMGGPKLAAAEWIGMFYGLGTVVLFLGATALGRLSVIGLRDVRAAEARAVGPGPESGAPARTERAGMTGPLSGWRSGGVHRRGRRTPGAPAASARADTRAEGADTRANGADGAGTRADGPDVRADVRAPDVRAPDSGAPDVRAPDSGAPGGGAPGGGAAAGPPDAGRWPGEWHRPEDR
jgi:hypothetical protein